ncbi:SCO family protein [Thermobifida cellulosilytica]|uniref:SCO family protein n=1 Tax=Thermobifida cellulosilytica TaxID=144786 RepID=UPI001E3D3902|nr:SCO family protein [Thermobifida cellulosilytica]
MLAAAAVLAVAGCGQADSAGSPQRGEFDYYLDLADTPMTAPDHEFRTVDDEPWSFTDAAEGRLTLLYFGYTSCPDVCPTTMADIADAVTRLGADGERVDVVMVSTDPARDTPEQLRTWLTGFDPDFLGVIGPIDDVVQAAQAYGIPVEPPEQTDGNYLVTHGERVAVLRPGGDAVGFFDPGTSGEQMSAVLPGLLAEQL